GHPDGHPGGDGVRIAPHHVRHHAHAFLQVDERNRIRGLIAHARVHRLVLDGDGVHGAGAGRRPPFEVVAEARRTHLAGIEDRVVAAVAPLDEQFATAGGVPERGGELRRRGRLEPGRFGRGHRAASVPSTSVDMHDRTIPEPWATAISTPLTWRSPHSPRSWRTASTIRNMPYIPGCV